MPKHKRVASNVVFAVLILLALAITMVGNVMVQSSIPVDVPVGNAKVSVNVAQVPDRTTGHVKLNVLPP